MSFIMIAFFIGAISVVVVTVDILCCWEPNTVPLGANAASCRDRTDFIIWRWSTPRRGLEASLLIGKIRGSRISFEQGFYSLLEIWQSPCVQEGVDAGVEDDEEEGEISEPVDSLTGARGAQVHEVDHDQSWAVAEYEREQHVHEGFCDFRLSFQRVVSRLVLRTLAVHRLERLDLRTQAEVHAHEREHENDERDEHGGVAKHEEVPQEADLVAKKWQSTRDDPNHDRA